MSRKKIATACIAGGVALLAIVSGPGARTTLAETPPARLRVYFIDVEGGQATLFVTPAGQSLLIDTGWPGNNGRDADRIVTAAKDAGLSRLDYVLITHFHDDHVGGVPQLAGRIPVGTFLDHGENRELDKGQTERGYAAYLKLLATGQSKRMIVKAGEMLPITGITVTVISADGNLISKPLSGAGKPNSYCQRTETHAADQTENARSLGVEVRFGKLRLLDLGDLTWDKEMQLMCPVDKLGRMDVYVVSHHGWLQSSSPALVNAIHARVAIMDNGAAKGGSIATFETLATAPGLEALWQLHFSEEGGAEHNAAAEYIANPKGTDAGSLLKLTAARDGSFEILNARTGKIKRYAAIR